MIPCPLIPLYLYVLYRCWPGDDLSWVIQGTGKWSTQAIHYCDVIMGAMTSHQPHDFLLNCSFRRRSKKTSKLRVTGLCAGNSPVTGEFPAQMASNPENVSIRWRHHVNTLSRFKMVVILQTTLSSWFPWMKVVASGLTITEIQILQLHKNNCAIYFKRSLWLLVLFIKTMMLVIFVDKFEACCPLNYSNQLKMFNAFRPCDAYMRQWTG